MLPQSRSDCPNVGYGSTAAAIPNVRNGSKADLSAFAGLASLAPQVGARLARARKPAQRATRMFVKLLGTLETSMGGIMILPALLSVAAAVPQPAEYRFEIARD